MPTITREDLLERDGKEFLVTREGGKYRIRGIMTYQMAGGRDYFFVESDDDSLILKTGDEMEETIPRGAPPGTKVDPQKYCVDLTE